MPLNIKHLGLLLFLIILGNPLFAQITVKGHITDPYDEPLPGADVIIKGTKQGATADANGNYSFLYEGDEKVIILSVFYIGYKTAEREINIDQDIINASFQLEDEEVNLASATISAKSKEQIKREQPASVTVVDMKKIEGRSLTFNDVLNQAAGVKVLQKGGLGTSARMFVQGLDGKGVGIFVNGMPMGSSEEFQTVNMPTDMIKGIEVYKGIIPANLGGDGLSGAINIITKDYYQDHIEVSYEIASLNTHRVNLMGKKYIKDSGISLAINGMYDYSDNDYEFDSPYVSYPEIVKCDHNAYRRYGVNLEVAFTKQWFDMMSFSVGYDNQYKEVQGGMVVIQSKIGQTHVKDKNFVSSQNFTKRFLDGKLDFSLGSMVEYSIENVIDTSSVKYNWDGTTEKLPIPGEWGNFPNNSDDRYWSVRELLNVKYDFSDIHSINWNTSYKYNEKNPCDSLNDKYSVYSATAYASKLHALVSGLTYGLNLFDGKLKNELSGKYFYHYSEVMPTNEGVVTNVLTTTKNESSSFGWSEAIAWKPFGDLTIKASASQAVRIPVSYEIFGDGVMIVPSPNITPEKSFNINVGFNWLINEDKYPNLRIDINSYYMNVDDMIRLFSTESMKMAYLNLDKARIMGIEGEINADFTEWLNAKINFTYQDSRDINKEAVGGGTNWHYGYRIPNMPYCFGNAGIDLHKENLIGKKSYSSFFIDADYTHEFSYSWASTGNSSLLIPERWNFNIGISQSFVRHYHISFEVHNLFNNTQWSEFRYPLPGRTFHIKLRYTFN